MSLGVLCKSCGVYHQVGESCPRFVYKAPQRPLDRPKGIKGLWVRVKRFEVVWGAFALAGFCWLVWAYLHGWGTR